jgi:hypothetical protein
VDFTPIVLTHASLHLRVEEPKLMQACLHLMRRNCDLRVRCCFGSSAVLPAGRFGGICLGQTFMLGLCLDSEELEVFRRITASQWWSHVKRLPRMLGNARLALPSLIG